MGFFSLLIYVLAAGISTAIAQGLPDGPVIPTHRAPFDGTSKTVITVDWLFSTGGEVESASVSAKLGSSAPEKASKTTICAQKCSVLTFSTSCVDLPAKAKWQVKNLSGYSIGGSNLLRHDIRQPRPSTGAIVPINVFVNVHDDFNEHISMVVAASSNVEEDVSGSEPCTTEITVTLTTTIIEAWQSKTPVTTTLVRTRSTTIETVVVEAYSTSTGEGVVGGTRTATTTLRTVSSGGECAEVENCCAACSVTVVSGKVAAISSSLITGSATTVGYLPSSAGGQGGGESVSWQDGSLVRSPTGDSASEPPDAQTETETASGSASGTAGPTSIQTAGAASVTAAVGIGALIGIMGLLA
ncbi:hypothetical protein ACJ41O_003259 [Fusarium nematophilum]